MVVCSREKNRSREFQVAGKRVSCMIYWGEWEGEVAEQDRGRIRRERWFSSPKQQRLVTKLLKRTCLWANGFSNWAFSNPPNGVSFRKWSKVFVCLAAEAVHMAVPLWHWVRIREGWKLVNMKIHICSRFGIGTGMAVQLRSSPPRHMVLVQFHCTVPSVSSTITLQWPKPCEWIWLIF